MMYKYKFMLDWANFSSQSVTAVEVSIYLNSLRSGMLMLQHTLVNSRLCHVPDSLYAYIPTRNIMCWNHFFLFFPKPYVFEF
jgi:hypothetical protein